MTWKNVRYYWLFVKMFLGFALIMLSFGGGIIPGILVFLAMEGPLNRLDEKMRQLGREIRAAV